MLFSGKNVYISTSKVVFLSQKEYEKSIILYFFRLIKSHIIHLKPTEEHFSFFFYKKFKGAMNNHFFFFRMPVSASDDNIDNMSKSKMMDYRTFVEQTIIYQGNKQCTNSL